MRYIIAIITMLAICSCKPSAPEDDIEVVFSPGLVEFNSMNTEIIHSIKKPDKIYKITSNDYSFLYGVLASPKPEITSKAEPPYIFIKLDSIQYTIGENRVMETDKKSFSISENEDYRIRCIIHFYDFIERADLQDMREIKQFGIPANYKYCHSDPHKPAKPFVKIILQRQ
jgi:hypothetical protein